MRPLPLAVLIPTVALFAVGCSDASAPATVGFLVQVSLENDPVGSNTYVHSFKPSFTTYCQLTIGKKNVSVSCPA